jgi:hypothetical protein
VRIVPEKPELLLTYLARTVGIWKASRVGGYIAAWGIYARSRPDERHTVAGCGEYWRRSEASMWREQKLFRTAFPDEQNPDRIWSLVEAEIDRRSREKATADLLATTRAWGAI